MKKLKNIYTRSPFFFFASPSKILLVIGKNGNEYIGLVSDFNSTMNIFFQNLFKTRIGAKKKSCKIYKAIILNGSKLCFFSLL